VLAMEAGVAEIRAVWSLRRERMNSYSVKVQYEDREKGTEGATVKIEASSIAGAIAKAAREFVKGLDRKQRFDANKGLKIEASRVADTEMDAGESAKGASA
jgi:hypothetical protein